MIRTLLLPNELDLNCNDIILNSSDANSYVTIVADEDTHSKIMHIPATGGVNSIFATFGNGSNINADDITPTILISYVPHGGEVPSVVATNISAAFTRIKTFYLLSCQWDIVSPAIDESLNAFQMIITLPPGTTYSSIFGFSGSMVNASISDDVNQTNNLTNLIVAKLNGSSTTQLQAQYYYNTFTAAQTYNFSLNVMLFSTVPV